MSEKEGKTTRCRVDRGALVWRVERTVFRDDYKMRGDDPSRCDYSALYRKKDAAKRRKLKLMIDYIREQSLLDGGYFDDEAPGGVRELSAHESVLDREKALLSTESTTEDDVRRVSELVDPPEGWRMPKKLPDEDVRALKNVYDVAAAATYVPIGVHITVSWENVR